MGRDSRTRKDRPRAARRATEQQPDIDALLGITPGSEVHVVSADELRRGKTVQVIIGPGRCVWAKRLDMTSMLMNGEMPLPMMAAVDRLHKLREAPKEERLAMMHDPENAEVLEMLRAHAAIVVYDPKIVWPDADPPEPGTAPADSFTLPQLMKIWTETALVPSVTPADAWRFRQRPAAVDSAPVSDGQAVRPEAEQLDTDKVVHG